MSALDSGQARPREVLPQRFRWGVMPKVLSNRLNSAMVEQKRTDADLVREAAAGDRNSYRELVERYQRRVVAIAYELLRSREDAEDVAQETFVKAYLSLPEFKGQSSFYTWLYRIAYNMAIDFRRKIARRGGPTAEYDDQSASVVSSQADSGRFDRPDQMVLRKEQAGHLREVFKDLSDEHRLVVTLREIDGLSYEEISDVTGISKGTVMSRLHYARKRLQTALAARGVYGESPDDGQEPELAETLETQVRPEA